MSVKRLGGITQFGPATSQAPGRTTGGRGVLFGLWARRGGRVGGAWGSGCGDRGCNRGIGIEGGTICGSRGSRGRVLGAGLEDEGAVEVEDGAYCQGNGFGRPPSRGQAHIFWRGRAQRQSQHVPLGMLWSERSVPTWQL